MAIDLYQKVDALNILDSSNWNFQFGSNPNMYKKVNERVLSVNTPFFNLSTTSKSCGRQFITGYEPLGEIEITFLESQDLIVQKFLSIWKNNIFRPKDLKFMGGGYLPCFLYIGDGATKKTINLIDVQIVSIGEITYDYSGSALTVSASFIASAITGLDT